MTKVLQDIRHGARLLRRTPAFTALAIVMLGLGLGASTAMFGVVNTLWLRPLPYGSPDRLVVLEEGVPSLAAIGTRLPVNAHDVDQWRARSRALEGITIFQNGGTTLASFGSVSPTVGQEYVSAEFFSVLGIRPQLGRVFVQGDDVAGRDQIAIISDGLWRTLFNADANAIGQRLRVGSRSLEVVGVLPRDMRMPRPSQVQTLAFGADTDVDVWRPLVVDPGLRQIRMSEFDYACIGRMRAGFTAADTRADLEPIERDIAREAGAGAELHAVVTPLATQAATRARDAVTMLSAAVGVVLLIVCVNLANALLARATGRQKPLAIQAALGASRARLVRQAVAETVLLSTLGSAVGLALAWWALRAVVASAPLGLTDWQQPGLDWRVIAFVSGGEVALAGLLALLPAWRSGTVAPQDALRSSDRGSTEGRGGKTVRKVLIGVEVALSTTALVLAALLVSSFVNLTSVDAGFERRGGFVTTLGLAGSSVPNQAAGLRVARDVIAQIAALPGVTSVGVVNRLPLSGEGSNLGMFAEGGTTADQKIVADYRTVTEGYFAAMGIPLRAGRLISERDGDHLVGLVAESTAARLWPGGEAIGHHVRLGSLDGSLIEIIGVVGDVRGVSLTKTPNPTLYVPLWQMYRSGLSLAVRTTGDPTSVMAPTRRIVQRALPDRPAPVMTRLDEIVSGTVTARRFQLNVVTIFACIGVLLAAMGVYTVVAQSMARRTREVGIRIALGAARRDVWRLVGREGLVPVGMGIVVGLLASLLSVRLVRGMLFGVSAFDVSTYGIAATVMVIAAVAACAWPAYRSGRIDPLVALREL